MGMQLTYAYIGTRNRLLLKMYHVATCTVPFSRKGVPAKPRVYCAEVVQATREDGYCLHSHGHFAQKSGKEYRYLDASIGIGFARILFAATVFLFVFHSCNSNCDRFDW